MKLSKQERIGAFVIAILVILALGIFLFIKPRFEAISVTTATLEEKQQEYFAAVEKQATKGDLRDQVLDAYTEGENLADMFFPELTTYQADMEFRAFLEQCEAKIVVEDLSVAAPGVSTLSAEFYTESEVTYDLKSYVTQGISETEEELAAANRLTILQNAIGSSQDVGSIDITFTVSAIDPEELIKFCDEVNNYIKAENGGETRKAMMLTGFTFEYPLIDAEYDALIEEIIAEADQLGETALYKNAGVTKPVDANESTAAENPAEEQETLTVTDYTYSVSTTLRIYSIERMQDPTEQLDQQDNMSVA